MHVSMVSKILGLFLMVFSITLLIPIVVSIIYEEHTASAFFLAFTITFSLGMLMWLPFSRIPNELRNRDGFLITVLFWVVLGLSGTLPLMLVDEVHLSFIDALFESISGITTTGATVITGLEDLPKSILYYRQQLHFLGGIGIVVIAVAIMPMLGVGGMQLYRAEMVGPAKETKMTPRIAETAKALFLIYLFLAVVCTGAYWLAGMNFFDALTHSYSTVATGGFANYDASLFPEQYHLQHRHYLHDNRVSQLRAALPDLGAAQPVLLLAQPRGQNLSADTAGRRGRGGRLPLVHGFLQPGTQPVRRDIPAGFHHDGHRFYHC